VAFLTEKRLLITITSPLRLPVAELRFPTEALHSFMQACPRIRVQLKKTLRKWPWETSFRFASAGSSAVVTRSLMRLAPLAEIIEAFWLEPANRKTQSWMEHGDINMVMLATSLAPDGYVTLWERFQEIE